MVILAMDYIDKVLATNVLNNVAFSHSIQATLVMGKKTLNRYYSKTNQSNLYQVSMNKCTIIFIIIPLLNVSSSIVLHPQHKLHYFHKAKWEEEWITMAVEITQKFFNEHYNDPKYQCLQSEVCKSQY